jgi:hypothetical protein
MILLAHPYFLRDDAKQLERMKPYPVATRDLVRGKRPDDIGVSVAYPLPGTKFHLSHAPTEIADAAR